VHRAVDFGRHDSADGSKHHDDHDHNHNHDDDAAHHDNDRKARRADDHDLDAADPGAADGVAASR
jgi:hypothetical protein